MPWKIVQRKIGRAGGVKQRLKRQQAWDRQYGEGMWAIGYVVDGEFILQEDALETVYYQSYHAYFEAHPEEAQELVSTAKILRNPHAVATGGVDLQIPAIMTYLERHGLRLQGTEIVDIGTWNGKASHAISVRLSPLQIPCCLNPKWTLEKFWQAKKCLAVWTEDPSTPDW